MKELKDLEKGDLLVLTRNQSGVNHRRIVPVERLTKTQVVTEKHGKFKIESGEAVGTDWYSTTSIRPAEEEEIKEIREEVILRKKLFAVSKFDWSKLDDSDVEKVYQIIKEKQ